MKSAGKLLGREIGARDSRAGASGCGGEKRWEDWALECLAEKLLPLSIEYGAG